MLLWATCERRWLRSVVEAAHGGGRGGGAIRVRSFSSSSTAVLGSATGSFAVPQQKNPPATPVLRNASTSSRTLPHRTPPFSCKSTIRTRFGGCDGLASSHSFSAASSCSTVQHLRSFSSSSKEEEEEPQPLVLWVVLDDLLSSESDLSLSSSSDEPSSSEEDEDGSPPLVLMPQNITNSRLVASADEIVDAVNRHYGDGDSQERFVGGMGEQDPGVWFAPASDTPETDLLASPQSLELLGDAMERCRAERHGVPFSVHTAGVNVSDVHAVAQLKWHAVHVSLWAATPKDYERATGGRQDFGAVCGFIAEAVELGVPVEVAVLRKHAGAARDLARSLGARQVHVHDMHEEEDY